MEEKNQVQENYFQNLYNIDVSPKVKKKNNLSYISWAAAWAEIKKIHPDAEYRVYECDSYMPHSIETIQYQDGLVTESSRVTRNVPKRFWFDDGRTGWVKVGVTICGIEHIEHYPIMNFKNESIPAEKITSTDANKAVKRALAKACAEHGLALYIYEGEDIPEQAKKEISKLAAARKKVISAAQAAVKRNVPKDKIYALIGQKNGGVDDPYKIASAAICEDLIKEIGAMKA